MFFTVLTNSRYLSGYASREVRRDTIGIAAGEPRDTLESSTVRRDKDGSVPLPFTSSTTPGQRVS